MNTTNSIPAYFKYWGKTTRDKLPGISVRDHMTNVGHVARLLAMQRISLLELLGLSANEVSAFAASHDVGKISQGFQQKCPSWIEQNGLQTHAQQWRHCESDHSKISQFSLQNYLREQGMSAWSAGLWAAAVGGHHGRLHRTGERGLPPSAGMMKDQWETERQNELGFVEDSFGPLPAMEIEQDSAALWWLAGLTSVADWIGSDERFFPVDQQIADVEKAALTALEHIGFLPPRIRKDLDFMDLFGFDRPNRLQRSAFESIAVPGIYVIEAPMGTGKTEAALWCAYRLLSEGRATGIYFALPTQATSNRIHLRMADFISRISEDNGHTRLIHGNSWLMEALSMPLTSLFADEKTEQSDAVVRDWFASRKRALLAPFGVGTVDQALLGIVAARHFFVRRFALAGKVVIIDEVHSYDVYTGTLVNILCRELEKLCCTVIVLSATLTEDRCAQIFGKASSNKTDAYPLITGRRQGDEALAVYPILSDSADKVPSPPVSVRFARREEAADRAVEVAKSGGSVLWICDTVASAQADFTFLRELAMAGLYDIGLLHSRYPFFRRKELEDYWMERLGKNDRQGRGCILVATQVVEQSVDLDADLMISELAPTDMLLQRLGRLWRHKRQYRPLPAPLLIILEEERALAEIQTASPADIKKAFGSKALVYAPYILLRTWEVWQDRKSIKLPEEIRPMLKETYADRLNDAEGWAKLATDWFGNDYAKKQRAEWSTNVFDILLDDMEGVQTRLNEHPTVSIVLAHKVTSNEAILLDGNRIIKGDNGFDLDKARAINRCTVRVPRAALIEQGKMPQHSMPEKYVCGEACWAVVDEAGTIEVPGLGITYRTLRYTNETGIEIIKRGES